MTPLSSRIAHPAPDWVMVGVPGPLEERLGGGTGVWLYASKDLTRAELEAEIPRHAYDYWQEQEEWYAAATGSLFSGGHFRPPPPEYTITAVMRRFTVIQAPDYPAAFKALFESWTPGPAERPAVEGLRAIEGGPGG